MARLFVAVPAGRSRLDPGTGAGRVWHSVVPRLRKATRLTTLDPGSRRRPDVWLASGHEGSLEREEPVVAVVHGSAWMLDPAALELMPREFAEPFVAHTEAALDSASYVIVPSQYTRRGLTDGYGFAPDRVVAVSHGVDADVFNPARASGRARVAAALGEERPYVLFASIPSIRQKNLPALKEAMARLAGAGLPHALVIAGGTAGGEQPDVLEEIAADPPGFPGRVAWLGHVGDLELAGLMAEADAFCLPSLFESFGLTALEAMACGAPVVVSDRGALPEVVGDAGLVAEPTREGVAAALRRVLTEEGLAERLRRAGRERAERMSWEHTAQGWLSTLRRAATGA